jgi:hypothetical protein
MTNGGGAGYENMNTQFRRAMMLPTIVEGSLSLAARNLFRRSGDYSNGQAVSQPDWPAGMNDLVNSRNRIGGQFLGGEDIFYFAGSAEDFALFLNDYVRLRGVERHRLILHAGTGKAPVLSGGNRHSCDWKLASRTGTPFSDSTSRETRPGYVLEVHFWTDGQIQLAGVAIPNGLEVLEPEPAS